MNPKTKKPKILLPKRLPPLSKSVDDDSKSTLEDEQESLPLSSTILEGKTRSARRLKRVLEEEVSGIGKVTEIQSDHRINSIVRQSEIKKNSVVAEGKTCDSFERHKTGCPKCSGSVGADQSGDSELTCSSGGEDSSTTFDESESETQESSGQETSSIGGNTVVHPFCSSFNSDISQIPRRARFRSQNNISAISELDQTSRFRISDVSATESNKSDQQGGCKDPNRKKGFDIIKLNDSGSKCEYQFVDGVHQRFCSSYLGNGFNVPNQIRFPCDPRLSSIHDSSVQNISEKESTISETTLTEGNASENGDAPFCSSFRQDISQIPSRMTFDLEESISSFTSQRYNLRKRKVVASIQEEWEEEESTLKPGSDSDQDSNSESEVGRGSLGGENGDSFSSCDWLTEHKLTCFICNPVLNSASRSNDAASPEAVTPTLRVRKFKCGQCEKSFGRKGDLNRHIQIIHQGLKPRPSSCSICKKSFTWISNLKKHQKTVHEGRRDYICSTCGIGFGEKGNLQNHQKTVHEGRRDYICSTCGIGFGHKNHLQNHHRTVHEGQRDHICSTCGAAFGQKGHLLRHERLTHQGRKDHVCRTCGVAFGQKAHLLIHERVTHQGKKDHVCKTCGKQFGRKSHLVVHERVTHEGRKDHICTTCGKAFGFKGDLNKHMNSHGDERPFACSYCSKTFKFKSGLLTHCKLQHQELQREVSEDSVSD